MMRYIRTRLATDGDSGPEKKSGLVGRVLDRILPNDLPDYQMNRVREWLVEFDKNGIPGREVGLGVEGNPVLAGPDDRNYGFWLDTNMRFDDFEGEELLAAEFEELWERWHDGGGFGRNSA